MHVYHTAMLHVISCCRTSSSRTNPSRGSHLPGQAVSVAACNCMSLLCLQVTCGSTIKLAHGASNFRLHSHEVAYSRGSQQQSVTAYPTSDDGQGYWVVAGLNVSMHCALNSGKMIPF